jgi:hypothetical protein
VRSCGGHFAVWRRCAREPVNLRRCRRLRMVATGADPAARLAASAIAARSPTGEAGTKGTGDGLRAARRTSCGRHRTHEGRRPE